LGAPVGGGVVLSAAWLASPGGFGAPLTGGAAGGVAAAGAAVGVGGWPGPAGGVVLFVAGCAVGPGAGGLGAVAGWVLAEDGELASAAGFAGPDAGAVEPPLDGELASAGFGAGAEEPEPPLALEPPSEDDEAAAGFGAGPLPPEPPPGPGAGPAANHRWVVEFACVEAGSAET